MMAGYENKTILNNITDVDTLLQLLIKNEAYYLEIASIRANVGSYVAILKFNITRKTNNNVNKL